MKISTNLVKIFIALIFFSQTLTGFSQFVPVGDGAYTTQFPGVDAAGRNSYPSGTPFTIGDAATKPVPTNDWWSSKVKNNHSDNLFNYPFTMKTVNEGLVVTYIPWGVIDNIEPVIVGVSGLNSSASNVSDFSDWTVTMDWSNSGHNFTTTTGIGMPFIYFTKGSSDIAQVIVNEGTASISGEVLIIVDARNGADFAVYAPVGSTWLQSGNVYTSTLNGENYWSMAFIPLDAINITTVANEYKKYAYVFPENTTTTWNYDINTSVVRTEFIVETDVKEGTDTTMLLGLLPHQWENLASNSPTPNQYSYSTVRGEMKTLDGNHFSVENTFYGILPTLPYLDYYSEGFSPQKINEKIELLENDGLSTWTDSYNEGQMMNRLIQTGRIADLSNDTIARNKILNTIKTRLEDWLKAESGEVAFLFYYNSTWSAMLGYPAGHGQDDNINDHHFHWGYFIHAASFVEQFEPGWSAQWGEMIDMLVRDAACDNRNDAMFPFLRNFSPYAGHCWANGFATFPQGNDQESTSESMQFNSSLIHWGIITGNDDIRDLGIYLYTTEQSAVEEYWLDMNNNVFQPSQQYSLVSRVWGNSYDNGTFWTSDIAASYGIEMYPIHGGSLYLGQDTNYVNLLWNEIEQNTGILANEVNDNLWHDVMWEYLAFVDPQKAIDLYDSYPERSLKFGISDAQTYHWLHSFNVLGNVDATITSDYPLAASFKNNTEIIYVGHNYGSDSLDVTFSTGYVLHIPPRSMATSKDILMDGVLSSSFTEAYPGGSVLLNAQVLGDTPTKIEFVDGEELIGTVTQPPYEFDALNLTVGRHSFYARIYDGANFNITNLVTVVVGEQLPYLGYPVEIPGVIEAGYYDIFEGGIGQSISYNDLSANNSGDFRDTEYVDASMDFSEGAVVGWISSGEWLEYSIDVQQPGFYSLDFRYACGNQSGGGPFRLELNDEIVKTGISVNYSGSWDSWTNKTVNDIPFKSGLNILRLFFDNGELNIGEMDFSYSSPLSYDQPVADAGENILVTLPLNISVLNGSNSSDPGGNSLTYLWTQVYGPSFLVLSDSQISEPSITNLIEGVYLLKLEVSNGTYSDEDYVYLISSQSDNVAPKVSILSPANYSEYIEFDLIEISAVASDLIGSVETVEFYAGSEFIGSSSTLPYKVNWYPEVGVYNLTAIATDDGGSSTTSDSFEITIVPAPPCISTSSNGEFEYEFSPDDNNPTITFIPSLPGMGSPTCILYYGTNNGNTLPGYNVTPNVPFQINASEGTTIYFYYTYSYPGQGEHNNSANKDTYEIGSCSPVSIDDIEEFQVKYYPNPVSDILNIELPDGTKNIMVYDLSGKIVGSVLTENRIIGYDMSNYKPGIYFFRVLNDKESIIFKVIR